jgi:hypothetical protein
MVSFKESRRSMKSLGTLLALLVTRLGGVSFEVESGLSMKGNLPDCTGVRTGVTLVNSESKLLVSVALLI